MEQTLLTPIANPQPVPAVQATPPRFDMYTAIHKALRAFMADTLRAVGHMDPADEDEVAAVLAQTRLLLDTCTSHLEHENDFVHTALEARRPGSAARAADEHLGHEQSIRELTAAVEGFEATPPAARAAAALRLYRHLALFVAENFEHMNYEETAHNSALWAAYTDAELHAIHGALLASLTPQEMTISLRWMLPSLSHAERVGMLAGMRQDAPAPAFQGVLAMARAQLTARDWNKLAAALGV